MKDIGCKTEVGLYQDLVAVMILDPVAFRATQRDYLSVKMSIFSSVISADILLRQANLN